jgi:hypothetical protein
MSATTTATLPVEKAPAAANRGGQAIVLPGQTPDAKYILGVLAKRTYTIVPGQRCQRADVDAKLVPGDVHFGDPMNSTVKLESDFVPFKVATDVVLSGKAYAPGGKPAVTLTASVVVGTARKDILVIGDRVAKHKDKADPVFTEPQPFTSLELRYERAYGGVDVFSDPKAPCAYPRNHLGRGFAVGNVKKAVDDLPLPNFEDPKNPLAPARLISGVPQNWERQPLPQGFGWYSKYWQPRVTLAGVLPLDKPLEQQLRKAYAETLPADQRKAYEKHPLPDMDFRFFNGASLGLALPFLKGDEEIRTINLTPEGEISFRLPAETPRIGLDTGAGAEEAPVVLHTVMIRMEERRLDLVWRAAFPYPGPDALPQLPKMEVLVQ